jgi:hypothetical protein
MRNLSEFKGFLTERGAGVYTLIKSHCQDLGIWRDAYAFELAMLSNSFALYYDNANYCNDPENGVSMTFTTEKGGTYSQVRPEYTVMKTEYGNILKHSAKFGLNPGDLKRVFGALADSKEEVPEMDLRARMRAAK